MSRWFPESVELQLDREGLRLQITRDGPVIWTHPFDAAMSQSEVLHAIPEACQQTLHQLPRAAIRNVRISLGAGLVRYRVVPWHGDFIDAKSRAGFAQHCFVDTYGDAALGWTIALSPGGFGEPTLAAGIDRNLLVELEASAKRHGIKQMSIEPELCSTFQRSRRQIPVPTLAFVLADGRRMTCLLIVNDAAVAVQTARIQDAPLAALLERLWQVQGLASARPRAFVAVTGKDRPSIDTASPWQVTLLATSRRGDRPVGLPRPTASAS